MGHMKLFLIGYGGHCYRLHLVSQDVLKNASLRQKTRTRADTLTQETPAGVAFVPQHESSSLMSFNVSDPKILYVLPPNGSQLSYLQFKTASLALHTLFL